MQSFVSYSVSEPTKLKSKFLLTCSVINILLFPICVGLEVAYPYMYQGIWGSIAFFFAGILGFSTSYTPEKLLLWATLVFSFFSVVTATISCMISSFGNAHGYSDCIYVWNSTHNHSERICSDYYYPKTQIVLLVAEFVAVINNLVIMILCSRIICNCCKPIAPPIPIVAVHRNVHNAQQQTPIYSTEEQ
ncbi:uncharacterized protein LOC124209357 [Daphnia pulex]|uniref:uncharacterized protein LOC124209357 n=1 Tax=Daphnia pulex TaxID=6669 RepID=UPI001EDD5188|nr:uncharacterized protein LOC124209357 [Daphnia pulex]